MIYNADIELGGVQLSIGIDYWVTRYVPATYLDPPEDAEVVVVDAWCDEIRGATYELGRIGMGLWVFDLDRMVQEYLDSDFIHDHYDRILERWNDV